MYDYFGLCCSAAARPQPVFMTPTTEAALLFVINAMGGEKWHASAQQLQKMWLQVCAAIYTKIRSASSNSKCGSQGSCPLEEMLGFPMKTAFVYIGEGGVA